MYNPLSFSDLVQRLYQIFHKPVKPVEAIASMGSGNVIDSELVYAFSQGSESAFRSVYDQYAPAIYRVALRYFQSGQLAEDLVSEVFAALWKKRTKFSEPEEVRLFLFTRARNVAVKYLPMIVRAGKRR